MTQTYVQTDISAGISCVYVCVSPRRTIHMFRVRDLVNTSTTVAGFKGSPPFMGSEASTFIDSDFSILVAQIAEN